MFFLRLSEKITLRSKHANANKFALLSASAEVLLPQSYCSRLGNAGRRPASPVPPVVSGSPGTPVPSGRNRQMQINLHCSRLLRKFTKILESWKNREKKR